MVSGNSGRGPFQGSQWRYSRMICRPSRERSKQTHLEVGIVVVSGEERREQNALRGAKKLQKTTRALEDPQVKSTSCGPAIPAPVASRQNKTEYSWGLEEEEEKLLVVQNPLVRPPLRKEQKRCMGKCPYCPHGSSSTAASSRMSEGTPDPFPYLGGFRTRTHR